MLRESRTSQSGTKRQRQHSSLETVCTVSKKPFSLGTARLQDGAASMQRSGWGGLLIDNISQRNFISQIFKRKVDSETCPGFFVSHLTPNWCVWQRMIRIHLAKSHKSWKEQQQQQTLEGISIWSPHSVGWTWIWVWCLWPVVSSQKQSVEWYTIYSVT